MKDYYERYLNVLSNDVDEMLREEDKKNRTAIMKYLELMEKCEAKMTDTVDDADIEWAKLSKEAQEKILSIIAEDLNYEA